VSDIMY